MPIIQSVDRALGILDLFDDQAQSLRISDISARMGLHKSTVHSLLRTLQSHGYITQESESGRYRLGMKLVEKGQLLLQGLDTRNVARPSLDRLSEETGQTAHLVILDGSEGVYIDKVEGVKAAIRYSRIGRRVPIHCSAVGKVLAAYQPESVRERLIGEAELKPHTASTIRTREALEAELAEVRKQGLAYDREENEPGVRCVAAPVFNHAGEIAAAVSISTLISHVDDGELGYLAERLKRVARQISADLGHRG